MPNRSSRSVNDAVLSRHELLVMLLDRLDEFQALPPSTQILIDRSRLVPTKEMHGILFHYLATGHFSDEIVAA
jgi:hypothetical protein